MISGELISGGLGERSKPLVCKTSDGVCAPPVRSNRTPSTNFATEAEALTSAPAFNHTAEAMQSATELYASAVSFPRMEKTQWTNNRNENNAVW